MLERSIWIGFDQREAAAYAVARHSAKRRLTQPIPVFGLVLADLRQKGMYTRPIEYRDGPNGQQIMWDTLSEAPMSTEFACSRFMVPILARTGWAMFADCDVLFRDNLARIFDGLDKKYAVYCVKHNYQPSANVKMDDQVQVTYNRKLWSSVCIFNCNHPANKAVSLDFVNSRPGRDMHAFCWLKDEEIADLDETWNWVPGHSSITTGNPSCVHWSAGGPWLPAFTEEPFAAEWHQELNSWATAAV